MGVLKNGSFSTRPLLYFLIERATVEKFLSFLNKNVLQVKKVLSQSSSSPDMLNGLNPQQLEAVTHTEGPLLIFAGAGSGKTRVLTRRISYLIGEKGVRPSEILAVTFTNKAANEMKQRVINMLPRPGGRLWISTFHSICARILRAHAEYLDFTSNFAIYDTADSKSVMKRVYKNLNVDPKILDPKTVLYRIEKAKHSFEDPESVRRDRFLPDAIRDTVASLFVEYQRELHEANAMDFGDLIYNTLTLFKLEPLILAKYQEQFRYILIDEYQDTNKIQYLLISLLAKQYRNICVVGDDDQSIYAFRGATIENILNFRKDYPDAKVVTLSTNYRSTQNILNIANSVIAKNMKRQEKQMNTPNPHGEKIRAYKGFDEGDEAEFVLREIHSLFRKKVEPKNIAIFYRTNAQSRIVEEGLCEHGVPYEIYGGFKFYDRKEIKDIIAYLRVVSNPKDNEAFLRIVNTPSRGIGPSSLSALIDYAKSQSLPLRHALQKAIADNVPFCQKAVKKRFSSFSELLHKLTEEFNKTRAILSGHPESRLNSEVESAAERVNALSAFLRFIADESDYLERLKQAQTDEAQSKIENIYELFSVANDFVANSINNHNTPSIESFLERTSLTSDSDNENKKGTFKQANNAISLMTLHLAKGLEFDYVFLIGLEEGLLPHVRSMEDKLSLEEERRLCYVGVTRAKKRLFISRAGVRNGYGYGSWYNGMPSRFIYDMPEHLLEDPRGDFVE